MSFLGSIGKVFSTAGSIMSAIPGLGTIPGVAASAAGGLLSQMGSEQDQKTLYNQQLVYNSPKEQMKRLQEAGLNPNLIYGTQGVTGMSAKDATAPNLQQYSENPYLKMSPQQIQEMAIQRRQQENLNKIADSTVEKNEAQAENYRKNTELQEEERIAKSNYNSIWNIVADDYVAKRDLAQLAVEAQRIENAILDNKKDISEQELKEMLESYPDRMATITQKLENLRKEGKRIDATTAREYASIALMGIQGQYYSAMAGYADENTRKLFIENDLNEQTAPMKFEESRIELARKIVDTNGAILKNATGSGELSTISRLAIHATHAIKTGKSYIPRVTKGLSDAVGGYQYHQHYYKK